MEYKISNRLRMGAIVMIVLGALGVAYGFYDSHSVTEDNISEVLAAEHHGHGDAHATEGGHGEEHAEESHGEAASHAKEIHGDDAHGGMNKHEEHALHQIHNRPYSALYVAAFFFFMIAGFFIRGLIFLGGWSLYRYFSRKFSIAQDNADDNRNFKKNFRISAAFLVFYIYTESMMSWDWIMSVDPHWFSTLFGWYVFASMFVSGITVIAMVSIYLKSKGLLEFVNDSHIHDLAKFMFGISIFWTYLWFSQFMLIWYADIPEEVTYFVTRINDYKLPFFGMLAMNFIFPLLLLMNSDYKRINWFVIMAGIVILCGHYVDVFNMIMPATVGPRWFIGVPEISSILLFGGLFLFIVFTALGKAPLLAKRNPFTKESEHFHY